MDNKIVFKAINENGEEERVLNEEVLVGKVTNCYLNPSQTMLVTIIEAEGDRFYYRLNVNPVWGSFFQKFCEEHELIDQDCVLEPSKMEGEYVFFAVYCDHSGDKQVRWIEAADQDMVNAIGLGIYL